MRLQTMVHNPLVRAALKDANMILELPHENNWVRIETIHNGPVYLHYGTIHHNGDREREIGTIGYDWLNGKIISVRRTHV